MIRIMASAVTGRHNGDDFMSDQAKKPDPPAVPKNPISRREWVARAIEVAREAVADAPPAKPARHKAPGHRRG